MEIGLCGWEEVCFEGLPEIPLRALAALAPCSTSLNVGARAASFWNALAFCHLEPTERYWRSPARLMWWWKPLVVHLLQSLVHPLQLHGNNISALLGQRFDLNFILCELGTKFYPVFSQLNVL